MPIIVDEVVISVEVTNQPAGNSSSAPPGAAEDRQALVEICAERVLDILKQKSER